MSVHNLTLDRTSLTVTHRTGPPRLLISADIIDKMTSMSHGAEVLEITVRAHDGTICKFGVELRINNLERPQISVTTRARSEKLKEAGITGVWREDTEPQ